ncbi:SoxR reducing system RseC family protein [Clostridium sp. DL1XJH146]
MLETGVVTKIVNKEASVQFIRKSGCGENCNSCKMECNANFVTVEVKNTLNAKVGDNVKVEMKNSSFNKMMFFAYGLPLIMLVIGSVIGYSVFKSLGNVNYELYAFIIGMAFFGVSYIILNKFNKKVKNNDEYGVIMKEIM